MPLVRRRCTWRRRQVAKGEGPRCKRQSRIRRPECSVPSISTVDRAVSSDARFGRRENAVDLPLNEYRVESAAACAFTHVWLRCAGKSSHDAPSPFHGLRASARTPTLTLTPSRVLSTLRALHSLMHSLRLCARCRVGAASRGVSGPKNLARSKRAFTLPLTIGSGRGTVGTHSYASAIR